MVSVLIDLEKKETECVNGDENKDKKNIDEPHESILQQTPAKVKVKTQSDTKAWKQFCLQSRIGRCVTHLRKN